MLRRGLIVGCAAGASLATLVAVAQGRFDWVEASTAPLAERAGELRPPENVVELGLGGFAKVLCSAVFVSGRDADEARANSAFFFLPEAVRDEVVHRVDRRAGEVRAAHGDLERTARHYGDQGCVLLPRGADDVHFEPVPVRTGLPDPTTQAWPMGDVLLGRLPAGAGADEAPWTEAPERGLVEKAVEEAFSEEASPADGRDSLDRRLVERAVERAFADVDARTAAFLVVHRGRIVGERYARGIDKETQLESWSMGKSLTAALVGILIEQGELGLDQPAPVPAWRGDGRSAITVRDLLQMSSGLRFIAPRDPDYGPELGYPDHMYVYSGAIDSFEFSISRPLEFPPGTVGRYRNSDPLTLGYVVRETVRRRGEEYLTFPQRALFDRIGIRRQVLEPDPYGNFLLTGFDYGTARNWARLGLLFLEDGVFEGERILPEGFAEFVATPAPAWEQPIYGGLFWLNRTGELPLPEDAYYMAGGGGQRVVIVPSLELVVVRLGHFRGNQRGMELLDGALELLARAVDSA